jgi:hypothetical protein
MRRDDSPTRPFLGVFAILRAAENRQELENLWRRRGPWKWPLLVVALLVGFVLLLSNAGPPIVAMLRGSKAPESNKPDTSAGRSGGGPIDVTGARVRATNSPMITGGGAFSAHGSDLTLDQSPLDTSKK